VRVHANLIERLTCTGKIYRYPVLLNYHGTTTTTTTIRPKAFK
jgi:hypothetical protein